MSLSCNMERPYIDAARNQSCINNDAYSGIVVHSSNIRRVDEQVEKKDSNRKWHGNKAMG